MKIQCKFMLDEETNREIEIMQELVTDIYNGKDKPRITITKSSIVAMAIDKLATEWGVIDD